MTANIHFDVTGDGPPVILMHGLFGAGGNLGALARSLRDRYRVYSLDLPNHGRSDWTLETGPAALSASVLAWMKQQQLTSAHFVGHSLGGKVAMELGLASPEAVSSLVIADIAPVAYPPHHNAVFAALDAVIAAGCQSRAEAATVMEEYLRDPGVIQFLLMSLTKNTQGNYQWRFNLEGIKTDYSAVRAAPVGGNPYGGPVLFIKGGESDYILPEHRNQVLSLFPQAEMKVMAGCGHWLHAQQPALFNGIVGRFLDRQGQSGA